MSLPIADSHWTSNLQSSVSNLIMSLFQSSLRLMSSYLTGLIPRPQPKNQEKGLDHTM